jgi:hypothetical protein
MMTPTVHLNGTSREELMNQLLEAIRAIDNARNALARARPHDRDYYPQGDRAIGEALLEHTARMRSLCQVAEQLEWIAMAVDSSK